MFLALCRSSSETSTVFELLVYKHLWRPPVVPSEWELPVENMLNYWHMWNNKFRNWVASWWWFSSSQLEFNYWEIFQFLMLVCPCIASVSLKYNQQDATFSRSIYLYKLLYMFQAVSLPIIRSTKLYIQCQVFSNHYCYHRGWDGTKFDLIYGCSRRQYWFDNTWGCM
jgi:hypothetical protein